MQLSYLSLVGALAMLVIGVVVQAILSKLLYRRLRDRHETAKAYGRQVMSPVTALSILSFVNLVLLPLLGFLLGHVMLEPYVR